MCISLNLRPQNIFAFMALAVVILMSLIASSHFTLFYMHLSITFPRCFRKTGSPSLNFSVVKTFQKCYPPDFKVYLSKLTNKKSPHKV